MYIPLSTSGKPYPTENTEFCRYFQVSLRYPAEWGEDGGPGITVELDETGTCGGVVGFSLDARQEEVHA